LERLGVARLGDGLVGLPAGARTREQLEWIAEEITEAGGTATVWLGTPASGVHEDSIADGLRQARAAEYSNIAQQAMSAGADPDPDATRRTVRRLRDELGRVARRDFFPPPQRDEAHAAVDALAARLTEISELPR
jgi:hypothetical protein